jgi:hypothetical protein
VARQLPAATYAKDINRICFRLGYDGSRLAGEAFFLLTGIGGVTETQCRCRQRWYYQVNTNGGVTVKQVTLIITSATGRYTGSCNQ